MRVAVVLLTALMCACGERAGAPEPSPEPNRPVATTPGETRARITTDRGAVDLRSGPAVPVALPSGFTIYPGARIIANTRVEREGGRRVLVEFATPDPIAKVVLFHRAQAEAAGVLLMLDLDGDEAASIGGRTVTGGDYALTARRAGSETMVQLSIGDRAGRGER